MGSCGQGRGVACVASAGGSGGGGDCAAGWVTSAHASEASEELVERVRAAEALPKGRGPGRASPRPPTWGPPVASPEPPLSLSPPMGYLPFPWSFCPDFISPGLGTYILVPGSVSLLWCFAVAPRCILVTSSDSPPSCRDVCSLSCNLHPSHINLRPALPLLKSHTPTITSPLLPRPIPFALGPVLSLHGPFIVASL